jgi:hypothetical protein
MRLFSLSTPTANSSCQTFLSASLISLAFVTRLGGHLSESANQVDPFHQRIILLDATAMTPQVRGVLSRGYMSSDHILMAFHFRDPIFNELPILPVMVQPMQDGRTIEPAVEFICYLETLKGISDIDGEVHRHVPCYQFKSWDR